MAIPDTLQLKIDHFRRAGRLVQRENDPFGATSWLAVHVGQSVLPDALDPLLAHAVDPAASGGFVDKLAAAIAGMAASMPTHRAWIDRIGATA